MIPDSEQGAKISLAPHPKSVQSLSTPTGPAPMISQVAASALRAAVLSVAVTSPYYLGKHELQMTATITEAAATEARFVLAGGLNGFAHEGSDGDDETTWYVQARDCETGRTFWLNLATDQTETGCSVTMHVHNYAGLDYTRSLSEPSLDDRLAFASIIRRLFA